MEEDRRAHSRDKAPAQHGVINMLPSSGSRRDRMSSYPKDMNVPVVVRWWGRCNIPAALVFFFSGFRSWGANVTDDRPRLAGFLFFFFRDGVVRRYRSPPLRCPVMITGTLAYDLGRFY